MNRWLQTKRYTCPGCGTSYLHDKAHRHACFECPQRPTRKKLGLIGKTYELMAGR